MDIRLVTDGEKWAVKRTVKCVGTARRERFMMCDKLTEIVTYSAELFAPSDYSNSYSPWVNCYSMGSVIMDRCWMERAEAEKIFVRLKCMEPATK